VQAYVGVEEGAGVDTADGTPHTSTSQRVRKLVPCNWIVTTWPILLAQLTVLTETAVPIVPHCCVSTLTSCTEAPIEEDHSNAQARKLGRDEQRSTRTALFRRSEQQSARLYTTTCHDTSCDGTAANKQLACAAGESLATLSTEYARWRSTFHHDNILGCESVCVHEPPFKSPFVLESTARLEPCELDVVLCDVGCPADTIVVMAATTEGCERE